MGLTLYHLAVAIPKGPQEVGVHARCFLKTLTSCPCSFPSGQETQPEFQKGPYETGFLGTVFGSSVPAQCFPWVTTIDPPGFMPIL